MISKRPRVGSVAKDEVAFSGVADKTKDLESVDSCLATFRPRLDMIDVQYCAMRRCRTAKTAFGAIAHQDLRAEPPIYIPWCRTDLEVDLFSRFRRNVPIICPINKFVQRVSPTSKSRCIS